VRRCRLIQTALFTAALALGESAAADDLAKWAASPHRTPSNVARDPARHGLEVLRFFEVRDTSVVVEILPGSAGYYLEILAPCYAAIGESDRFTLKFVKRWAAARLTSGPQGRPACRSAPRAAPERRR